MAQQALTVTNWDHINNVSGTTVTYLGYWVAYSLNDCRIVVQLPEGAKHYCLLLGVWNRSGTHTACCSVGTKSFPGSTAAGWWRSPLSRYYAKVENAWRHTHAQRIASSFVQRMFINKTNVTQPSEIWVSGSGVHNDSCLCLVLPCQLVNSYRLQNIEDEDTRFLRNVGVCYITRYTAPDPRIIESSEKCISYTQK